jgi:Uma2 family endonuclease
MLRSLVLMSHSRITYDEVASWPDDGRRYELYDGEVSVVPAPLPRHQLAMLELQDRLRDYVTVHGGLVIVSPIDIVFSAINVLQPDIVVFTAARRHLVQLDEAIRVPPDVVVEVLSPSTAANDRGRKMGVFERFGVPEYWMLDPAAERIEIRRLRAGRFAAPEVVPRGGRFESGVLPRFSCGVDSLFPW